MSANNGDTSQDSRGPDRLRLPKEDRAGPRRELASPGAAKSAAPGPAKPEDHLRPDRTISLLRAKPRAVHPGAVIALQRAAGNAAVGNALLTERRKANEPEKPTREGSNGQKRAPSPRPRPVARVQRAVTAKEAPPKGRRPSPAEGISAPGGATMELELGAPSAPAPVPMPLANLPGPLPPPGEGGGSPGATTPPPASPADARDPTDRLTQVLGVRLAPGNDFTLSIGTLSTRQELLARQGDGAATGLLDERERPPGEIPDITTGKMPAPPLEGKMPAPPLEGKMPAPPLEGKMPAPPLEGKMPAPPLEGKMPAPPLEGKMPAPPLEGKMPAPPLEGKMPAPPLEGKMPAPPLEGKMPAPPLEGKMPAPPLEGKMPAPPAAGAPERAQPIPPEEDPRFQAMQAQASGVAAKEKKHAPAKAKVAEAHGAAVSPPKEVSSMAAAAQVGEMAAAKPKGFDKAAFVAAVRKAIEAAAPKDLSEADDFKESGKAGAVKNQVGGMVKEGKEESESDVKEKTEATPDTSKVPPKEVTPLPKEEPGAPPPKVGAKEAMPPPKSEAQTDLSAGPREVEGAMAEADVDEEQLKKSNEPEFQGAVEAKKEAAAHSETAPAEYRKEEKEVLAKAKAEAADAEKSELDAMHVARSGKLGKVLGEKAGAKSADEAKRAEVAAKIDDIYKKSKDAVTGILDGIEPRVDAAFTAGEEAARSAFESYVDGEMERWKEDRYGGWFGWAQWAKDKIMGLPPEVNVFYSRGRQLYLQKMDATIEQVAEIVGGDLTAAKARIAQGRQEVDSFVASLSPGLKKVGLEAKEKIQDQFDSLEQDVDSKQEELVDTLAKKYVESRDTLDSRIDEMKAANKGLVSKAIDAVKGVIETILKLKDMLLRVLAKAADVIGKIIKDPIGFLKNLIGGIKGGMERFIDNIKKHLGDALKNWLFGALGAAGIEIPDKFDFKGVLHLVLQVLGLTYRTIRDRVIKKTSQKAVELAESGAEKAGAAAGFLKKLMSEGPGALWEWLVDKIGDLKDMVIEKIKDWAITKVITAGITWIISLLNPASAFIKAAKAIYDIIMFIVERGAQIMEFVNTVLDTVSEIAKGSVGKVIDLIEKVLAKGLPLVIGFLASLLGLGGIAEKIKGIIEAVRKPVMKAVDKVIDWVAKPLKKLAGAAKKAYAKGKAAVKKGFEKAKKTAGKAVLWVGEKLGLVKTSKKFTMAGEPHTLTALAKERQLEVTMASGAPAALGDMLEQATSKPPVDPNLAAAKGKFKKAKGAWDTTWLELEAERKKKRPSEKAKAEKKKAYVKAEAKLNEVLEDIIASLSKAKFPELKNKWIAEGYDVRLKLYEAHGWPNRRNAFKGAMLPRLRDEVADLLEKPKKAKSTSMARVTRLVQIHVLPTDAVSWFQKNWDDVKAGTADAKKRTRDYLDAEKFQIDHQKPLAWHWVKYGYNSLDKAREEITLGKGNYGGPTDLDAYTEGNLQLMYKPANTEKGAQYPWPGGKRWGFSEQPWVGPAFGTAFDIKYLNK